MCGVIECQQSASSVRFNLHPASVTEEGMRVDRFHHRKQPERSTLLAGRQPPDEIGFASERLQIWYNSTVETWADPAPHMHLDSDECFIVLYGSLLVEVEGERVMIGPREFCCFPRGV